MPVLRANGVTKSFGRTPVLNGADLWLCEGVSVAVTGPSGSGKSTLMAIIGLLSRRDGGSLSVFGHEIGYRPSRRAVAAVRGRMAWLPQAPLILPGRTALDNVLTAIRCRREIVSADLDYALELFAMLGVGALVHRDVSVLSGGELQKIGLIRALAVRPELLVADEPTASLDARSTHSVIDALRVAAQLCTLVVASHDADVARFCDRVVTIADGRVDEQGR